MKLGISSYTYTWSVGVHGREPAQPWNENDLLEQAVKLGVKVLQIADNLPLHDFPEERLKRLKERAEKSGIQLEAGARGMTPWQLERYVEIASFLDSPILRFVIDGPGFQPRVEEVIRILKGILPRLEEKGIQLAVENHDRLKAIEFKQIVETVSSDYVKICLDSVNSMGASEGTGYVTGILAPYTVNLHIKDFIVQRHPHMMGFTIEGRPAGEGQLPVEWMLKQLGPACRSAVLELWTPPEETIEKTVDKEREWAERSIRYLKENYFNKSTSI